MSQTLLEFRAGRCTQEGTTVTADRRKGLVRVVQDPEGMLKVLWMDRITGNVEDDLFVFPGSATWRRVQQCTTGRVYLLDIQGARHFYWMQEPKEEGDSNICTTFRQAIFDEYTEPSSTPAEAASTPDNTSAVVGRTSEGLEPSSTDTGAGGSSMAGTAEVTPGPGVSLNDGSDEAPPPAPSKSSDDAMEGDGNQ